MATTDKIFNRAVQFSLLASLFILQACGGGNANSELPSTSSPAAATAVLSSVVTESPPVFSTIVAQPALPTETLPAVELTAITGLPGLASLPTTPIVPSSSATLNMAGAAPNIIAITNGKWNNPASWNLNRTPANNEVVSIPANIRIDLDGATAKLGGLWLQGQLHLIDTDGVLLNTRFTIITGLLQAGTPAQPFTNKGAIELWGTDPLQNILGMGTKNLAVMSGGMLSLHGKNRLAWTKLDANVSAGSSRLILKDDASTWRVGDQIVLASGSIDPRDAQTFTLTAVNKKQIDVSPALVKPRYGMLQTFNNKVLDQRPAIGLLSRNLVVRGAADSDAIAFGGHIMVMKGGHAQVSGIDLQRMGQRGLPGRYPMHWHEAGDRLGDYAIANSINNSFQRAIVLHSTSQVQIDSNVAYDVPNHAFVWAEDGDEVGNVLTRNLSVLVRTPAEKDFAFPINSPLFGNSSQGEGRSAGFWGRSLSKHVIRDNISAGVLEGFGYFVDLFTPAPDSPVDGSGMIFDGNTAHSTLVTLVTGNQINYPEATRGHGLMVTTGASPNIEHVFQNYTGYQNTSGAWLEDRATVLKNSIVADNGSGIIVLRGVVDDVTIVGNSANTTPTPRMVASVSINEPAGIQIAGSNHGGKRAPLIRKATVINQQGAGILWDAENISPAALVDQVSFINTPKKLITSRPNRFEFAEPPIHGFIDSRGLFASNGVPSVVLMADTTLFNPNCTADNDANAVICPISGLLILQANQDLNLVEESGQVTFLRQYKFDDESMPVQGTVSWVGNGRRYQVDGISGSAISFNFQESLGKIVEIEMPTNGMPRQLTQNTQALTAAPDLNALRAMSTTAYFFDAAKKRTILRYIGTATNQKIDIAAEFIPKTMIGKIALATTATGADGFDYGVYANSASYQLRYPVPNSTVSRSARSSNRTLDNPSFLTSSTSGDTTVIRGFVYAPDDGFYRLALWGSGGGTSVWIGDAWVMGEPWAFINSNNVINNALTTEVVSFHINRHFALRAGWHPITVIHAKIPDNKEGNSLNMRWSTPSNPASWVYPNWKASI
jgi:G8 domain